MPKGIGDRFQRETKYIRGKMPAGTPFWEAQPGTHKEYPRAKKIKLPDPVSPGRVSVLELLKKRKSVRDFTDKPIAPQDLSYLLWAACGVTRIEYGHEFRTAPSAGALYPVETYIVTNDVETIPQGVYHYSVRTHSLDELKTGDFSGTVSGAALEQYMCATAAVIFMWTAVFGRSKWKYGERAYRYIYLDAGHIAANLSLAAVDLGLGSCQIGSIFDDEANAIVDVNGEGESVIYMSAVGYPATP